ncbi:GTPase IMAP family member 8-like protein [Labeo rohita]|uniref:ribonuclease H n=1 Tax=Labeo rohita TaxID=84645 RepID=A0A498LXQ5_LABRO|nr:GTPase IMAP family member 8-like protein [Labeo rohita]
MDLPIKTEQCESDSSDSSMDNMFPSMTIVLFGYSSSVQYRNDNILLGEKKNIENEISRIVPLERKISECDISVINMVDLHKTEHVDNLLSKLMNKNEIHAFIFVVPLGQLTNDDKMSLDWLQKVFGDKVLQFVMILFTYEGEEECNTVKDDLRRNPDLQQLLDKCRGRYQTCNKMMNNQSEMRDLMKKIEHLFNENQQQSYTGEMFKTASIRRKELENSEHRCGHTSEMEPNAQLNLILLGKHRAGKSASGNTILGQKAFVKKNSKSVTREVAVKSGTVNGFSVTVYDTPGFHDPKMSTEEIQQILEKVIQKCESGLCVFLLVIKADNFTEEERETVEKIEKLLGEKRLEKTWILFTRGDELQEENKTIIEFINETEALKKLIQKYNQKYHVFNNKKKGRSDQARLLLVNILQSGLGEVRQPYVISLKPGATPFSLKTPRRIPLPLMGKVKEELHRMEMLGVISRVEEPTDWCAGMVVVPKKSGAVRICVDLSKLNESVRRKKYILPSVEQTLGMLAGAQIFSKLDANMGFWQIPLSEESARIEWLPEVTDGLEGTVCHIDDVLVWGRTEEEHDSRLHVVLEKMQKAGITLNVEKCKLSKRKVHFLGHIISAEGISPDPMKTAAIRNMTEPSNVSELRSFLGMVNQLGRFIPQLADKDKALRDLLSKKNCWIWGMEQAKAFQTLKDSLSSPPVLAIYDTNRDCKVSADALPYGLGAVLMQRWQDGWKPIAYASRSLTQTEQRYAQVDAKDSETFLLASTLKWRPITSHY